MQRATQLEKLWPSELDPQPDTSCHRSRVSWLCAPFWRLWSFGKLRCLVRFLAECRSIRRLCSRRMIWRVSMQIQLCLRSRMPTVEGGTTPTLAESSRPPCPSLQSEPAGELNEAADLQQGAVQAEACSSPPSTGSIGQQYAEHGEHNKPWFPGQTSVRPWGTPVEFADSDSQRQSSATDETSDAGIFYCSHVWIVTDLS
mmetsp:Transcript_51416/g.135661  ORF Transcript_51416/g.135661 Transcript_51416/m.135661 type:complete len:200 (+) Transcript_51416:497-1096(+)